MPAELQLLSRLWCNLSINWPMIGVEILPSRSYAGVTFAAIPAKSLAIRRPKRYNQDGTRIEAFSIRSVFLITTFPGTV